MIVYIPFYCGEAFLDRALRDQVATPTLRLENPEE